MVKTIIEIFNERNRTFSIEYFPPKTDKGTSNLMKTVAEMKKLGPDFVSVTYGAGGSTGKATLDIINNLYKNHGLTCMHHLTLVNQTKDMLKSIIRNIKASGIRNILALRGDPPPEIGRSFRKIEGGMEFCYELIDLIKEVDRDYFSIAVAGFPEGHADNRDIEENVEYLKIKADHGAHFVITQLFFNNDDYFRYLDLAAKKGIRIRILPGILPITDYRKLLKFCETCGAYVCKNVHDIFEPISSDVERTFSTGIEYCARQCEDLLKRGAPGLHFYSLNRVEPVASIWKQVVAPED